LLFVLWLNSANATMHSVSVTSNMYTPSTLSVTVGDTIRWIWNSGFHSVTSSTVPAGVNAFASPSQSTGFYDYVVATAGSYTYECAVHGASMAGSFTASAAAAISDLNASAISLRSFPNPASEAIVVEFNLPTAQAIRVDATDLAGRTIELSSAAFYQAGRVRMLLPLASRGIAPGIYTVRLSGLSLNATQRVVVQ